ncbi:MAG: L-serine ammonia-lyase, iron-sulfur-dependent, subunit beta [Clostridiales bacterium]|nr:L-serine ammonia-lyase, iron-sulfur-dependent, subunit beta [Clostridiales bacterium]
MSISIFDIIGPVAVGPSSSHTAGAVKIGNITRSIVGGNVDSAEITFYGSFAHTYLGHGTDRALLGGLLGLAVDDVEIRNARELARKAGLRYTIATSDDPRFHPNTVRIVARNGVRSANIRASSVGGGAISLDYMNGYIVGISCNLPTLIVPHRDLPGTIAAISHELASDNLNIAYMKLSRAKRGGSVVVVFEIDSAVPVDTRERIRNITGIDDIIYISPLHGNNI